ncbi:uncharacterized protein LOC133876109 [Alnus glutinosa]|uniref:uncharacterized protein LOC133876109 n=1 Tax=Alnus glutinosa TaxID=3517 RepID=UPI002D788E93|nr:uncharacterized protein LOC133876109 [Alnus glutinosa]
MAANSQQFGTRIDLPSKHVNEVNISSLEQQIVSLTSLVHQMAVGNMQTVKACGICLVVGHPTDMCPTLQEEPIEQVNAAGGFSGQPQRKNDPYSRTYNLGWRDHPNLSYGNPQVNQPATQNRPSYQQYKQPYPPRQQSGQTSNSGMSLEDIVKSLAINTLQFQQETRVEIPVKAAPAPSKQEKEKNIVADRNVPNDNDVPKRKFPPLSDYKPVPHFPQALAESRKYEQNKDLYETFRRCKRKQKLKGCEKVRVGENVSAVIQRKFFAKCKDPGMFTIPCTIGNTRFEHAMIDLGASINVMPYSIYASLKLGPLNKTSVVIQLADRSIAYRKGVVEDVLVQINDLVFPANFYVLDMENNDQTTSILLGRPFLKTPKTKVDVYNGTLTMEFDAQEIFELDGKYGLEVAISKHLEKENEELALSTNLQETVAVLNDFPKLQQSDTDLSQSDIELSLSIHSQDGSSDGTDGK